MRILIVEDSLMLRENLAIGLRDAGYAVDTAADGIVGLELSTDNSYDLVVLDIQLPGLDGLAILERLRKQGNKVPVLMLTARDTVQDRVLGLRSGADDYLVKPFDFDELLARIEALIRRHHKEAHNRIITGAMTVDLDCKQVSRDGVDVPLAPREYALLEFLVLNRSRVVTRSEIEEHIYDERVEPMSNVVDSAMSSLRRAIDQTGEPSAIITRRGLGYQFNSK